MGRRFWWLELTEIIHKESVFLTASMQVMEIKCSWISRYEGPGPALQKVQVAQGNKLWTQEWLAHSSITACQVSEAVRANKSLVPHIFIFFQSDVPDQIKIRILIKISFWCGSWYPDNAVTFATPCCALPCFKFISLSYFSLLVFSESKSRLINLTWVTFPALAEQLQTFTFNNCQPHGFTFFHAFLMGIFINNTVASCDQPAILLLFWDQEYLVLLTWVLSSSWICFLSKAHFLFCTFFPLYYQTHHCCGFNIRLSKTALKMLFFSPLISLLVWLFIQVAEEPCSYNLIFLSESRFFFLLEFKVFSAVLLQAVCSCWHYSCLPWHSRDLLFKN